MKRRKSQQQGAQAVKMDKGNSGLKTRPTKNATLMNKAIATKGLEEISTPTMHIIMVGQMENHCVWAPMNLRVGPATRKA